MDPNPEHIHVSQKLQSNIFRECRELIGPLPQNLCCRPVKNIQCTFTREAKLIDTFKQTQVRDEEKGVDHKTHNARKNSQG